MKNGQNLANISVASAKQFLAELANVERDGMNRFLRRYGRMIPNQFSPGNLDEAAIQAQSDRVVKEERMTYRLEGILTPTILDLRNVVRRVWVEPDLRTKRYGVFLLWKWAMYPGFLEGASIGVPLMPLTLPPPTLFEQSLQYLLDSADLAHYCANPDCPAPYFFAKRRSQRYCSDACAEPARREFKRKWWTEHGEEWRAERKGKKPAKKGKK